MFPERGGGVLASSEEALGHVGVTCPRYVAEPFWVAPLEIWRSRDGSESSLSREAELSSVFVRAH